MNVRSASAWTIPRSSVGLLGLLVAAGSLLAADAGETRGGCEVTETARYLPPEVGEDGLFGRCCAIDGDTMIVSAPGDEEYGNRTGSAFVYRRIGAAWVMEQRLIASDGQHGDDLGQSIALRGDVAIIGAPDDDDNAGSAYVFRFDGATWQQEQKLQASDGQADDRFGCSVAVGEDVVIVGAFGSDENGDRSGVAYCYRFDGSAWGSEAKIAPSDAAVKDYFGYAVAIDGDKAVIGARRYEGLNAPGAAYVFHDDGVTWVEDAKVEASDGLPDDFFGCSASIEGDQILVGAYGATGATYETGAAYIYRFNGATWVEVAKLFDPEGWHGDRFGFSVSLNGAVAAVGALDGGDVENGIVALFRFDGSTWGDAPLATFIASDPSFHSYFGISVSMDDDTLVTGTPGWHWSNCGSAYVLHDVNAVLDDCEGWVPPSCTGDEYDFIDIGTLGGLWAFATAINDDGQIVGYSHTEYGDWFGFLWEDDVMTALPPLPGYVTSYALDMNNSGQIVGYSAMDEYETSPRATLWENGVPIDLGTLGGYTSMAYAINDNGQIVGWASGGVNSPAFIYENGVMSEIYFAGPGSVGGARAINDDGVIAGSYGLPYEPWECPRGDTFIYEHGMGSLLWQPTAQHVYVPSDINAAGIVVGYKRYMWYMDCAGSYPSGWKWDLATGQGQMLPAVPGSVGFSVAAAVNEDGDIVGSAVDPSEAALWRADGTCVNLNDFIPPDCELFLRSAADINNRGQIVGKGAGDHAILINPIITGDVNGDFVVDVLDLLAVLGAWGPCPGCPEDINGDGVVNVLDLLEVLANWS